MFEDKNYFCNFCGKHKDFVETLIAAPKNNAHICSDCIELSITIVKDFREKKETKSEQS
jgi:ATP-dependent protease Clp ATPase subunit